MPPIDLGQAALRMANLVGNVADDRLPDPTPCPDYRVSDLLDHIGGLALAFTSAATKQFGQEAARAPSPNGSLLGKDWRTRIPDDLADLAAAWREPSAWTGMTRAGGVDLPGEVAGIVALDELVIHGWDLARATGQPYECDAESLEAVHGFVIQFSGPGQEAGRAGLFGPEVEVAPAESLLNRVVGLTGRDPAWTASIHS